MNLKKSDKIIAIVGVLVLIVAAVGIVLFTSGEDTDDNNGDDVTQDTYMVYWERVDCPGETVTATAGSEPYLGSISVNAPTGSVLTDVYVTISWEDDNIWGLISKKGHDTLTAKITPSGQACYEMEPSVGSGNETVPFDINDKPESLEVEAKDSIEALSMVEGQYISKNSAMFDVEVTVTTGEGFKLLMPIRSLLNNIKDKGNDFDITVSYAYYQPYVEEAENDDLQETSGDIESTSSNGLIPTPLSTLVKAGMTRW